MKGRKAGWDLLIRLKAGEKLSLEQIQAFSLGMTCQLKSRRTRTDPATVPSPQSLNDVRPLGAPA